MYSEARNKIYDYVKKNIIGPFKEKEEKFNEHSPLDLYYAAILYPNQNENFRIDYSLIEIEKSINSKNKSVESDEDNLEENVIMDRTKPSSMGLSCYIRGKNPSIKIEYKFNIYNKNNNEESKKKYTQNIINGEIEDFYDLNKPDKKIKIGKFNASIFIKWTLFKEDYLTTIVLINNNSSDNKSDKTEVVRHHMFQCELKVIPKDYTQLLPMPGAINEETDEEKITLNMLYRNNKVFATGHGCSVDWECFENNRNLAKFVRTEFVPSFIINDIDFDLKDIKGAKRKIIDDTLQIDRLAGFVESDYSKVTNSLENFNKIYIEWIESKESELDDLDKKYLKYALKQIELCKEASLRIEQGIELIKNDEVVRKSFILANKAMLIQMIHSEAIKKSQNKEIDIKNIDYKKHSILKWRPFQLSFVLMSLSSIVNPKDKYRKIVDLIWFPTGGGKTEAYLLLSAFTIFYLRIKYKKNAYGTNIIMRYTLRALTVQQFLRTSYLICACDYIRMKEMPDDNKPISIGLFVGSATTPNRIKQAFEHYEELKDSNRNKSQFILQRCPWCNTELIIDGIECNKVSFGFYCPNVYCHFHVKIPINIIDDMLYRDVPDLLIGTVDKFARLCWEKNIYNFFGSQKTLPPSLIIQDELHLISGPLGSIAGAYETAIDYICTKEENSPKIISATATIKNAQKQCRDLFNREVRIFPSPALDINDSFFQKSNTEKGRMYIGVMLPSCSNFSGISLLSSLLLQSINEIDIEDNIKDKFSTLIAFFNNLNELGKTQTLVNSQLSDKLNEIILNPKNKRNIKNVEEFTSRIPSYEISNTLYKLTQKYESSNSIDLLLSTNMISVGLDIDRLNLMEIIGQPKSTAEYIQASSRIGRKTEGIVFVLYSNYRARDKSHYEEFKAYHSLIYKEVEPTSLTPFASRSRERTLHAVFIIMCRYLEKLRENAFSFNKHDKEIKRIKEKILERVCNIDPDEINDAKRELEEIINIWDKNKDDENLRYFEEGRQFKNLIVPYFSEDKNFILFPSWKTLNSMRTVEPSIRLEEKNYD